MFAVVISPHAYGTEHSETAYVSAEVVFTAGVCHRQDVFPAQAVLCETFFCITTADKLSRFHIRMDGLRQDLALEVSHKSVFGWWMLVIVAGARMLDSQWADRLTLLLLHCA